MRETRYKVLIDDTIVAENMDIEIATTLVKALFEKYYNDYLMMVSIKQMSEEDWLEDLK